MTDLENKLEGTSAAPVRSRLTWMVGAVAVVAVIGLVVAVVGYFSLSSRLDAATKARDALEGDIAVLDADLMTAKTELSDLAAAPAATTPANPLDVTAAASNMLPQFTANGQPDPAIGRVVPDIAGEDYHTGEPVTIASDRPTMIMIFAHWCPYCQGELPFVQQLVDEGVFEDNGVALVAIGTFEDPSRGSPFEDLVADLTFPIIRDDDSRAQRLGHGGVPAWVVVDADGVVLGRLSGAIGEDGLRSLIERVGASATG